MTATFGLAGDRLVFAGAVFVVTLTGAAGAGTLVPAGGATLGTAGVATAGVTAFFGRTGVLRGVEGAGRG